MLYALDMLLTLESGEHDYKPKGREKASAFVIMAMEGAVGDVDNLCQAVASFGPVKQDGSPNELLDMRKRYGTLPSWRQPDEQDADNYWRKLSGVLTQDAVVLVTWDIVMLEYLRARGVGCFTVGPRLPFNAMDWHIRVILQRVNLGWDGGLPFSQEDVQHMVDQCLDMVVSYYPLAAPDLADEWSLLRKYTTICI